MKPISKTLYSPGFRRWTALFAARLALGLWVAAGGSGVFAADTIEYSKKTGKIDLPPVGSGSGTAGSRPFDFLRPNSPSGGFVEPLPNPSLNKPNISKKLFEYLDQKKNWMFVNPKEVPGKASLNEMFKVQDEGLNLNGGKPKKQVEKFLEGDEKPAEEGTNSVSNATTNETKLSNEKGLEASDREEGRRGAAGQGKPNTKELGKNKVEFMPGGPLEKGPSGAGFGIGQKFDLSFPGANGSGSGFAGGQDGKTSLRQQQQLREDRATKLYQSSGGAASPVVDPIHLRTDTTSTAANPTLPVPGGASFGKAPALKTTGSDLVKSGLPTLTGPSSRSASLEEMTSRTFNVSGPSSSFLTPQPSQLYQPKPAVLEFPRRRF